MHRGDGVSFLTWNFITASALFCSAFSKLFDFIYSCAAPAKTLKYEKSKEPETDDDKDKAFKEPPVLAPVKPFRDPLASQTQKVDREYLMEMCKSLIVQGYLPFVVMSDLA